MKIRGIGDIDHSNITYFSHFLLTISAVMPIYQGREDITFAA